MIPDLQALLERAGLCEDASADEYSLACPYYTTPMYLIFHPRQSHPVYVMKTGDHEKLTRVFESSKWLYGKVPETIPEPVSLLPLNDDVWAFVQRGLPGDPWLRVIGEHNTTRSCLRLRDSAFGVMTRFHDVVRTNADWKKRYSIGEDFDRVCHKIEQGTELSSPVARFKDRVKWILNDMGDVDSFWQHGDFVINNLIFSKDHIGVIDLDDFGECSAPFLDNFALAFSINSLASMNCDWHSLDDDVRACIPETSYSEEQMLAFFGFFLFRSFGETMENTRRIQIRKQYLNHLQDVAEMESYQFLVGG